MLSMSKTHLFVPDFIAQPVNGLLDAYRAFQRCEMPCEITPMQVVYRAVFASHACALWNASHALSSVQCITCLSHMDCITRMSCIQCIACITCLSSVRCITCLSSVRCITCVSSLQCITCLSSNPCITSLLAWQMPALAKQSCW